MRFDSITVSQWERHQDTQWWFCEPSGRWRPVIRTYKTGGGRWAVETGMAALFSWINQEHHLCDGETLLYDKPQNPTSSGSK